MKKIIIIILLFRLLWTDSFGQIFSPCTGVNCTQNTDPNYRIVDANNNVHWDFSNWDWTNQEQCNWIAYPSGIARCINPPFQQSTQRFGDIVNVYNDGDYTNNKSITDDQNRIFKPKGWKLVYANFTTAYPYYLLYNEYTSILRVFFYAPALSQPFTYYGVTLSFNQGYMPGILSVANPNAYALDQYNNRAVSSTNNDTYTLAVPLAATDGWSCVDFLMLYDPNIGSAAFSNTSMQVQVWTMDVSKVQLSGDITGKISGPFSMTSGSLSEGTINLSETTGKFKDFFDESSGLFGEKSEIGEALSAVTSCFGIVSAALGIGEILVAAMSQDDAADSKPPQISALDVGLNVNMSGTITLQSTVAGTTFKIPGTTSSGTSNLYNCPMGIINLSNTPSLTGFKYNRLSDSPYESDAHASIAVQNGYWGSYIKYQLNNDLNVVVNPVPGMKLLDVKFAFKFQANGKDDNTICKSKLCDYYDITNPVIRTDGWGNNITGVVSDLPNIVYNDINNTGKFIIHEKITKPENANPQILDDNSVYGTPYFEENCLKGIIFDVPTNTNIWFSLMALFINTNTNTKYLFQQSYAVNTDIQYKAPLCYYYTPCSDGVTGNYLVELPACSYVYGLNEYTCGTFLNSSYYLNQPLLALNQSGTTGSYQGGTIALNPGFSAQAPFSAVSGSPYVCTGAGQVITGSSFPTACSNTQGQRIATYSDKEQDTKANSEISVYPNPSTGDLNLELNYPDVCKNVEISILNSIGKPVYENSITEVKNLQFDIFLKDIEPGLYILKIIADGKISYRKIVINN